MLPLHHTSVSGRCPRPLDWDCKGRKSIWVCNKNLVFFRGFFCRRLFDQPEGIAGHFAIEHPLPLAGDLPLPRLLLNLVVRAMVVDDLARAIPPLELNVLVHILRPVELAKHQEMTQFLLVFGEVERIMGQPQPAHARHIVFGTDSRVGIVLDPLYVVLLAAEDQGRTLEIIVCVFRIEQVVPLAVLDGDNQIDFYHRDKLTTKIVRGDYEYNGSADDADLCLIVVKDGNVTVKADFSGLIICDGDVTLDGAVEFTNASEKVLAAYSADSISGKEDGEFFKSIFNFDFASQYEDSVSAQGDAWNVAKLVTFSKWKKD